MLERIPSGIDGLDNLIEGGLPKYRTFLVSGGTGAGKTIFSMQYLYNGATKYGDPGVYVTLDERPELIRQDMSRFGWDIKELEDEGKLILLDASITRVGLASEEEYSYSGVKFDLQKLLNDTAQACREIGAKRVVFDSIASLGMYYNTAEEVRAAVLQYVYLLSKLKVTTLMVSELADPETNQLSKYGVEEFVTDGVFLLKYLNTGMKNVNRTLLIRKMRGTNHSPYIHPVEITNNGIQIKTIEEALNENKNNFLQNDDFLNL